MSAPEFSLFFFANDDGAPGPGKYQLLLEAAKFGDAHGFSAIWTPERHFHPFGGPYPNPAVTGAAIAVLTQKIQIRSGSVVLPLQDPLRVAEEWAVVDNLSNGRVGISFAPGWAANDFVLASANYPERKAVMYRGMETVKRLWRGEAVSLTNPTGEKVSVLTYPRPVQASLPIWITTAGTPESWRKAGELGANVLTHLLNQEYPEVAQKVQIYRRARAEAGHAGPGCVSLMIHTFVHPDRALVEERVREPFRAYLKSSAQLETGTDQLSAEELEELLDYAYEKYFRLYGIFGTPTECVETVQRIAALGIDELGCLMDFGIDTGLVLESLPYLDALKNQLHAKA